MGLRTSLLGVVLLLGLGACHRAVPVLEVADWQRYQQRFISAEGRVVDTGNQAISHSEGQGYGMLLAVAADDRAAFQRLWDWTRGHLQVRGDPLFVWKWVANDDDPVPDRNNATDGDLLIAWALWRAARRWGEPAYHAQALAIARALRSQLVQDSPYGPVLIPAGQGFARAGGWVLNLSYWVFPALAELAELDPDPLWGRLTQGGLRLLERARFGAWGLPPDWLALEDGLRPAAGFPARFGYDALRIPLYLCWAGLGEAPVVSRAVRFWDAFGTQAPPAWVDLESGERADHPLSAGARVLAALVRACHQHGRTQGQGAWPQDGDYYSSTLYLLSRVAARERGL